MSDNSSKQQPRLKERLETICVEMIDKGILFSEALEQFEMCFMSEVLKRYDGNLMRASVALGVHRNTLAKRMNRHKAKRG